MLTEKELIKAAYFKRIGYTPHNGQKQYHDSKARFRLANCGRRFGKAEAITNLLPMADGSFKTMADIAIGDFVLDNKGKPVEVVNTTEIMYDKPCVKVVFNDGTEIIVAKDHLWTVVDKAARKALSDPYRIFRYKTLTAGEMQSTLTVGKENNYAIELAAPIEYATQDLAVDPYLLGTWLGDGCVNGTIITTNDTETLDEITKLGFTCKHSNNYSYYVYGLRQELAKIYTFDYIDDARNTKALVGTKYVPEQYLIGDINQRLALLQGLMDTDGTIATNGHCMFENTNIDLAKAAYRLVASLGMKPRWYTKGTTYTYKGEKEIGKLCYRVEFTPLMDVFRLTRKSERILPYYSPSQNYRFITDIVDVPSQPVKCIQVANSNGLYLTSQNYVITHNSFMAARDLEPKLLLPNQHFWIVGPTYDLAEKEFRVIWKDMIVTLGFGKDPTVTKVYNKRQGDMRIEFKNRNTLLEVKSAQIAENLVGDSLDGVIMSEAAKHNKETWERYIRPALSDRQGFADFTTTPEGYNWLYDEWMHGKDPSLAGTYESWKFPSWYNDVIYPGGIENPEIKLLKKTMSKAAFDQEIGADFGSFVGKIYAEWDVGKHIKSHEFRPDWPNYIAFDWGFTNPMAGVEFQISPQDEIYIWREYYEPGKRVSQALREMKNRQQPSGYHIDLCFGDAADPEAVETVNAEFAPCVANPDSKTNWRDGVDLVISFLERDYGEDEFGGVLGTAPALFVDPKCENIIREFNNYKSPEGSNGKNAPESAIKQDDHALDALRYGLVHIYRLGCIYSLDSVSLNSGPETTHTPTPTPITDSSNQLGIVNDFAPMYEADAAVGFFTAIGEF